MRRRELIRKLKALHAEPVKLGWFPGRTDLHTAAATEQDRLIRLFALVSEIIEKLEAQP